MAEQQPVKKGQFNESFLLPALDIIMFILLIYLGGWYYYSRWGTERIDASQQQVAAANERNAARVDSLLLAIEAAKDSVAFYEDVRTARADQITWMAEAIDAETRKIQELRQTDQVMTNVVLEINARIRSAEEQLRSKERDLEDRRLEIEGLQDDVAELEGSLADTLQQHRRLQNMIADLNRERQRDPISIFPTSASVASVVEMGTNDQRFYAVSLAGVLATMGDVNLGLTGQVGLASEGEQSVKEGGFFANIPLAFRRASLDLSGGLSSITDATGNGDITPHAGAMLRYAPMRKERFFLLAGTKYRDEDVNLQIGLGFGRR